MSKVISHLRGADSCALLVVIAVQSTAAIAEVFKARKKGAIESYLEMKSCKSGKGN
jgi:hypothetical protein